MYRHLYRTAIVVACLILAITLNTFNALAQRDTTGVKITLPADGKLVNGKPTGKGWINLLDIKKLNQQPEYWKFNNGILHGDCDHQPEHHYSYSKKIYADFEAIVTIKMTGDAEANSGVCIRIHHDNFDKAPGYQVDMGKGYWGSLWEEGRAGMVQHYPTKAAAKLVKANDYNHYYIIARGHHIEAWLNGVKTIDIVHEGGFLEGNIGIQLCHGPKHTVVDVKDFYVRELNL
ncbi:MAG: DUF1080 domain-containing protein [Bacteroidota bacterium]